MQSEHTFLFPDPPLTSCDPLFLAWLAGFVDGEGCITISRARNKLGNPTYAPLLVITNTVRAPLEEIAERVGAGTVQIKQHKRRLGTRPCYAYVLGGPTCKTVAAGIAPYLRVKAEQAALLAALEPLPNIVGWKRGEQAAAYAELRRPQEALYERMRALNGHSLRGAKPKVPLDVIHGTSGSCV